MGWHSWQRLQLEEQSGGGGVAGRACLICSENLQLGSGGWSVGLKIINQFFGMQVTETQLKGNCFAHDIKKNVGHELQVWLDQGAPVFLPSPSPASLALVSLRGK